MRIQITSIIFLAVIIAPALTTFFWMHYQRSAVKHDVELKLVAGVDNNELVLLKFTKDESRKKLKWEHSKEFEYNLLMYDVVKTKTVGDTIYYWCWPDIKETELENKFSGLVNEALGSTPFQTEKQEHIISYFQTLYYMQYASWQLSPTETGDIKPPVTVFNFFSSFLFAPFTPPPELV